MKKIMSFLRIGDNKEKTDYKSYCFSAAQLIRFVLEGCAVLWIVSFLFYDSILPFFLFLLPFLYVYLTKKQKELCKQRKEMMNVQFREAILAVSSHLQAGFSVENAFHEAYRDIRVLYGRDSLMAGELEQLLRRLDNNEQLEQLLSELAARSGLEDISEFAEVFAIARRGGGDIRGVIAKTAKMIGDKIEVRREIETMMSEKKLEQRIMKGMPLFMIGYLSITSKGYFDSLYHKTFGVLLMTGCILVYLFACFLIERILSVEL